MVTKRQLKAAVIIAVVVGILGTPIALGFYNVYAYFTAPTCGIVIEKIHIEAHSNVAAGGRLMVRVHHPESWHITIRDDHGSVWTYCVDSEKYDRLNIGDTASFD